MKTSLTQRWGDRVTNPDRADLLRALEELSVLEREHPDCWLTDEEGWTVSVYETGLVVFKSGERKGNGRRKEVCRRYKVPLQEAYRLWLLLQKGQRDEIQRRLSEPPQELLP